MNNIIIIKLFFFRNIMVKKVHLTYYSKFSRICERL